MGFSNLHSLFLKLKLYYSTVYIVVFLVQHEGEDAVKKGLAVNQAVVVEKLCEK